MIVAGLVWLGKALAIASVLDADTASRSETDRARRQLVDLLAWGHKVLAKLERKGLGA